MSVHYDSGDQSEKAKDLLLASRDHQMEVEKEMMLAAQHYFPVGKAGAKNKQRST